MKSIQCSYRTLPPLSNSLEWNQAWISLNSKLNLKDVVYDGHLIPTLNVSLTEFDQATYNKPKSLIPSSIIDNPFVHLLFIQCEDNEHYKSTVKNQIRDWLSTINSRKRQEWIIVLMTTSSINKTNNIFKIKTGVIDKIKMDFNVDKRDRCVQISRIGVNGIEDPNCWNSLLDKLKDAIVTGFNVNIESRIADVERSEGQRNLPGWNFCTFFILKESLALSYIGINLFQEAQRVYEQLEYLFHTSLDNNAVISQFTEFGGFEEGDDSGDLLSTTKKPYRQMILSNSISIFDFRLYLFACQCNIAGEHLGNIELVARRAIDFINMFSRSLQANSNNLRSHFVQYWKYVASMSTIQQCDRWFTDEHKVNDVNRAYQYSQLKAELYEMAIYQLQDLGIKFSVLPNKYPFAQEKSIEPNASETPQTTNPQLRQALSNSKDFDKFFIHLCSSGARYNREVGKYKNAWSLDLLVAGLNMERKHFESSLRFFQLLNTSEARSGWYSTRIYALLGQLISHACLNKFADEGWAAAALDLFQLWSRLDVHERGISDSIVNEVGSEGNWRGFESLFDELKEFSEKMEKGPDVPLNPSFKVSFASARPTVHFNDEEDGSSLTATIENNLPCAILTDSVSFTFQSLKHDRVITYKCDQLKLESERNTVEAICLTPAHDTFVLSGVEIVASGIKFIEEIEESSRRKRCLLNIPFDVRALDVQLERPDNVTIDSHGYINLKIKSERGNIDTATIRLQSTEMLFGYEGSELIDEDTCTLDCHAECVTMYNLHTSNWHTISLPYHLLKDEEVHKAMVNAQVVYESSGKHRQLDKRLEYDLMNPLGLDVQHTQMSDMTILAADVTASPGNNVRIRDVRLTGRQGGKTETNEYILAFDEKASYGFTVRSGLREHEHNEDGNLGMVVEYSSIEKEVYDVVLELVQRALSQRHLTHHVQWMSSFISSHHTWSHCGGYEFKMVDEDVLNDTVKAFAFKENERLSLQDAIVGIIEQLPSQHIEPRHWSTCTLPIKLESAEIVASVSMDLKRTLKLGEAAICMVSISTSGAQEGDILHYEFDAALDEWLMSGKARGEYKASPTHPFEFNITLLPIKIGAIALPHLRVYSAGRTITTFIENGQEKKHVINKTQTEMTFNIELPRKELLDWAREREKNKLMSTHGRITSQV